MSKYALHGLVAVNLLLAAVLAGLWFDAKGQLRNVHWQPPAPQTADYAAMVPSLPGIAQTDTQRFIAMLDRPLFSITRRPPPPPKPVVAAPPPDNLSTAQLSAVFGGGNESRVIILISGKHQRVRINEQVEGWTLESVQERSATFRSGPSTRTLHLPRAALAAYSGQPLPAPPAQPAPAQVPAAAAEPSNPSEAVAPKPAAPRRQPVFGGSIGG